MKLVDTLPAGQGSQIAFVGAGGKTSLMMHLANELPGPVIVTTSTHLGKKQVEEIEQKLVLESDPDLSQFDAIHTGILVVTGPALDDVRMKGLSPGVLGQFSDWARRRGVSLLIEGDGSRGLPVKTPAEHEPVIPEFVDMVVVCAGLTAIGKPVKDYVHRADLFSALTGCSLEESLNLEAIRKMLVSANGGLKGVPVGAKRIAVLNQVDDERLAALAGRLGESLARCGEYDEALICRTDNPIGDEVLAVKRSTAAIVLAAGASTRYGSSKQLAKWQHETLVHRAARVALESGLDPVVVVVGANADAVATAVGDLPVRIARNQDWESGQSTSIRAGILSIEASGQRCGAALFMVVDQPAVSTSLLLQMIEEQACTGEKIIAPMVEGKRVTPTLFSAELFGELLQITGDQGGRQLFQRHPPHYLPWLDSKLGIDLDTPVERWEFSDE